MTANQDLYTSPEERTQILRCLELQEENRKLLKYVRQAYQKAGCLAEFKRRFPKEAKKE